MPTVEQTTSTWGADIIGRQVHPTIAKALALHLPKPPTFTAPRCPTGAQHFTHTLAGVELVCHIEFEAAECGSRDEPDWPATATLTAAYVRDINIAELLSDKQANEIERAFLAQKEEA